MANKKILQTLERLTTEGRNPNTMMLDTMNTIDLVNTINQEDRLVAEAVAKCNPDIAACVDSIVSSIKRGGRLIYMGAGTSGRLGILDAVECQPTFSVDSGLVIGLIAGGETALTCAVEGAEDNKEAGERDLINLALCKDDIVVGIAASGRTPYVIGGLEYANGIGATTGAIVCNADAPMLRLAKHKICALVGPECITGSTRMKSGSAQKLILNMLSTASMVRLGKVFENLMVDVKITNQKLDARACRIIMQACECDIDTAKSALQANNYSAKQAICAIKTQLDAKAAKRLLEQHDGHLRSAIMAHKNIKF